MPISVPAAPVTGENYVTPALMELIGVCRQLLPKSVTVNKGCGLQFERKGLILSQFSFLYKFDNITFMAWVFPSRIFFSTWDASVWVGDSYFLQKWKWSW